MKQVRVEVHLSNGKELGPTTPVDLKPGEKSDVLLTATSKDFNKWTAHPEVRVSEHGHGEEHAEQDSEHGGEHDRKGKGEHDLQVVRLCKLLSLNVIVWVYCICLC